MRNRNQSLQRNMQSSGQKYVAFHFKLDKNFCSKLLLLFLSLKRLLIFVKDNDITRSICKVQRLSTNFNHHNIDFEFNINHHALVKVSLYLLCFE